MGRVAKVVYVSWVIECPYGRKNTGSDGPIRANRCRTPELNPFVFVFFFESSLGALKLANRRFEAIRANRWEYYENRGFSANQFARIDLRKNTWAKSPENPRTIP